MSYSNPCFIFSLLLFTSLAVVLNAAEFEPSPRYTADNWFKGNTHTHTTNSDGDSPPDVVAAWYKERGYDFLVLSDHNHLTQPEEANVGDDTFLIIPGEEISAFHMKGAQGRVPIHVNGLDVNARVDPVNDQESLAATLQGNIDAIRGADGVPHINHPNFRWAFSAPELLDVKDYKLLEVYNGHPLVNNEGDENHIGMEKVWDTLLTKGEHIYGIGVDDAHHFQGEFAPDRSNPGRCWVMVNADELNSEEIMEALEEGRFYFTTGIELAGIEIFPDNYTVNLKEDKKYRVEFIGREGDLLLETSDNPAIYEPKEEDDYVRAKVYDEEGHFAWTQPVFLEK